MFSYDRRKNTLRQVTDTPASSDAPKYSDGVFATLISDGDLVSNGSTGPNLFLVNLNAFEGDGQPLPGPP